MTSSLRLTVPDVPAARALAEAWATGAAVGAWQSASLRDGERLLRSGETDLAFVPTLSVLRDPEAFSVVPGVALVGGAASPVSLEVRSALDAIHRVGIDPRFAQEALLAQIVLKELYDAQPSFVPLEPGAPEPADLDAVLAVGGKEREGFALDLGREWFEMTTRPFVWALLAAPVGTVTPDEALRLRDLAFEHDGPADPTGTDPSMGSVTLAGWAHAGLDEWVNHLFYHRALDGMPEIPFVVVPVEDEVEDEDDEV